MTEIIGELNTDDIDERVQKALKVGFVADLVHWAETGDKTNVRHIEDNSRSGLEYELARQGWFWVGEGGMETVREWMNRFEPPKWTEEGPESEYQQLTLENSHWKGRYDPIPASSDYGISQESIRDVMSVLILFSRVRNVEICDRTGLSKSTVRRGLNYLIDKGVVVHEGAGREDYYRDIGVLNVEDAEIESELNPEEARLEWCRRYYNNIIE